MEYENPRVPDEVNLPRSHPLVDFGWMLLAVGAATATVILVLALLADYLVSYIPFELEKRLTTSFELLEDYPVNRGNTLAQSRDAADQEIQAYLQTLANSLIEQDPMPDGMTVTVHYQNDTTVNAFATLGGNVIIHQGLISRLSSENALSMVIAHEIEHIRGRHPIRAAGRGIVITLALMSITGFSDSGAMESLVSAIGLVSTLSFSREHETQADEAALMLLHHHYGHAGGADQLFEVFRDETGSDELTAFLSTHPLHDSRIATVKRFIEANSHGGNQALVALPGFLRNET